MLLLVGMIVLILSTSDLICFLVVSSYYRCRSNVSASMERGGKKWRHDTIQSSIIFQRKAILITPIFEFFTIFPRVSLLFIKIWITTNITNTFNFFQRPGEPNHVISWSFFNLIRRVKSYYYPETAIVILQKKIRSYIEIVPRYVKENIRKTDCILRRVGWQLLYHNGCCI